MDYHKDYYATLGVLPNAEDIVIRAAYKALAQRYHPDRYSGPADFAAQRMAEINEAYSVLSDPKSRHEYDAQRGAESTSYRDEPDSDAESDPLETDWATATNFYPEIDNPRERLRKISIALEFTYRALVLESKKFSEAESMAVQMEQQFLELYFGINPEILTLARDLIFAGKKAGAKELNEVIRVLGPNPDHTRIIGRFRAKFGLLSESERANLDKIAAALNALTGNSSAIPGRINKIEVLSNALGLRFETKHGAWGATSYQVEPIPQASTQVAPRDKREIAAHELDGWLQDTLIPAARAYLKTMGY